MLPGPDGPDTTNGPAMSDGQLSARTYDITMVTFS
jgi:hypothetical protein